MIKLNEHIVEIEGKQYVPAEIAVQAVVEALTAAKNLSDAVGNINTNLSND
tara:strand:+ start:348 stop:500 length:153 start_codon:yes stop_codon:yes gene_type:complete